MTPGGVDLAARRWPTLPEHPTVLVPFGSTEQHGPHLPFDTDSRIAVAAARAVADSEAGILVAPLVAYGSSGEHQDFPGTISIGTDALVVVTIELVRSLYVWAGRIVIVNGHGGNVEALSRAVPQMRSEGHDVAWAPCVVPGGDPHAGFGETSLMLHLAPDQVDLSSAVAGATESMGALLPRLQSEGVRAVSPSGVLGDPAGASAAEGARLFGLMTADLRSRIADDQAGPRGMLLAVRSGTPA